MQISYKSTLLPNLERPFEVQHIFFNGRWLAFRTSQECNKKWTHFLPVSAPWPSGSGTRSSPASPTAPGWRPAPPSSWWWCTCCSRTPSPAPSSGGPCTQPCTCPWCGSCLQSYLHTTSCVLLISSPTILAHQNLGSEKVRRFFSGWECEWNTCCNRNFTYKKRI